MAEINKEKIVGIKHDLWTEIGVPEFSSEILTSEIVTKL